MSLTAMAASPQTVAPSVAPKPAEADKAPARLNQQVPGSYIVKASGDGAAAIRRVFSQYDVELVNPLGDEQFELRLKSDPGLEVLMILVGDSGGAVKAIHPNYVYHAD